MDFRKTESPNLKIFNFKMQQCNGTGVCLEQTIDCNTYDKYSDFACEYNCKPVPCPNSIVCGSWLPEWLLGLKRSGVCISCDSQFHKKLDVVENTECPMCLETTTCVIQPNCIHPTCVSCFKRCRYGEPDDPEPKFPYSEEVEDEWENGGHKNALWLENHPLATKWDKDWNEWNRAMYEKFDREKNLRICPLCRK